MDLFQLPTKGSHRMMRAPTRTRTHSLQVLGTLLLGLSATTLVGQTTLEERVRNLESELATQKNLNQAQANRIQELELSLVSVLDEQSNQSMGPDARETDRLISQRIAELEESLKQPKPRRSSLRLYGQSRFVYRAFSGEEISTDHSFELEHMLISMDLTLSDDFALRFTPGVSHSGGVFILEAYGDAKLAEWLTIRLGRFLVPFNGVHGWAFPSDSFIEPFLPENAPDPFFYAPYWDEGLMLTGDFALNEEGSDRLWYGIYAINGLDRQGLAGFHKRNIGDNNENKTLGSRVSLSLSLNSDATLSIGGGVLTGRYDSEDRHDFFALEGDLELRWGDFRIYAEVMYREHELPSSVIENPSTQFVDVSRLLGFKLRPKLRFADGWTVWLQLDYLQVSQAPRMSNQVSAFRLKSETFAIRTAILGLQYEITSNLRVTAELGILLRDDELGDDIKFLAIGAAWTF